MASSAPGERCGCEQARQLHRSIMTSATLGARDADRRRCVLNRRSVFAIVAMAVMVSAGCSRDADTPPLAPLGLDAEQAELLQKMNDAGRVAFAGWTWKYELGAGCVLRIERTYKDGAQTRADHALSGYRVEIMPYSTVGFGVKALPSGSGASIDLFDASSRTAAADFSDRVRRLIESCAGRTTGMSG
jgi:hypothetical protein